MRRWGPWALVAAVGLVACGGGQQSPARAGGAGGVSGELRGERGAVEGGVSGELGGERGAGAVEGGVASELGGERGAGAPAVDPLAELVALGDSLMASGPEGGGSIRAKPDAPQDARSLRQAAPDLLQARVEEVRRGTFPLAAVKLRIVKAPQAPWQRNQVVTVVPKLRVEQGQVLLSDSATAVNAGAYYLEPGDVVVLRVEGPPAAVVEASYLERK